MICGEKVLFYKRHRIDNNNVYRVTEILREEVVKDGIIYFVVPGKYTREALYGIEKTQDFEGLQNLGFL